MPSAAELAEEIYRVIAQGGSLEALEDMVRHSDGAVVQKAANGVNQHGWSHLVSAMKSEKRSLVERLLRWGAKENINVLQGPIELTGGTTPLWEAGTRHDSKCVQMFLEAGADPRIPCGKNQTTVSQEVRQQIYKAEHRLDMGNLSEDRNSLSLLEAHYQEHSLEMEPALPPPPPPKPPREPWKLNIMEELRAARAAEAEKAAAHPPAAPGPAAEVASKPNWLQRLLGNKREVTRIPKDPWDVPPTKPHKPAVPGEDKGWLTRTKSPKKSSGPDTDRF